MNILTSSPVPNKKLSIIMRSRNLVTTLFRATAILLTISKIMIFSACGDNRLSNDKGDPWPDVLDKGHGTLKALYVPADGFAYMGENGRLTGVTVELIRDFAAFVNDKYDVTLEIEFEQEENWSVFYNRIVEGGDGLIGFGNVTITEARKEELIFSPPYMTNIASLITCRDVPELEYFEEMSATFKGMNALAFEGTLHETRLRGLVQDYFPTAEIYFANSNDEIVERVSDDCSYFAYIDIYNYIRATQRGMPLKRHSIGDDSAEQFGYIMPLGSTWDGVIEHYFSYGEGLTESDRYRNIMEKHLGSDLAGLLIDGH